MRAILMRDWDPIGVAHAPEAFDEYDAYVGKVYIMLVDQRATLEAIAAYLYETSIGHIGLSPSDFLKQRAMTAAKSLIAVRPEFDFH